MNPSKSIFPETREYLVNLFSHNGVDSVFSGHVHFENFDIEEHKGIRRRSNRKIKPVISPEVHRIHPKLNS